MYIPRQNSVADRIMLAVPCDSRKELIAEILFQTRHSVTRKYINSEIKRLKEACIIHEWTSGEFTLFV
jgi:hypothetical protein